MAMASNGHNKNVFQFISSGRSGRDFFGAFHVSKMKSLVFGLSRFPRHSWHLPLDIVRRLALVIVADFPFNFDCAKRCEFTVFAFSNFHLALFAVLIVLLHSHTQTQAHTFAHTIRIYSGRRLESVRRCYILTTLCYI